MAASGTQASNLQQTEAPHRQFRKRKANDDDAEEAQVAAASGDDREMRVQFHMQGFSGPESYRYGFHTADPYNPLERFEERDGEGRVRGHYSYVDPTGKRIVVNYAADPNGFQILRGDGSSQSNSGGQGAAGSDGGDEQNEEEQNVNNDADNDDDNNNNNNENMNDAGSENLESNVKTGVASGSEGGSNGSGGSEGGSEGGNEGGGSETGPFGADYHENTLNNAN